MRIYTDEIINAVCLHMAERKGISPNDVEVQLAWDEEYGFTAEVWISGRSQYIVEANLLEAIERYMLKHYQLRVYRSQIKLDADEEFWADIDV
ncbi:YxcD family protein [Paenibacillus humicola]|uniref:YxcD family protein n=1 Tax=Paenibacillus humicola TaxID=3110540 RepID=UPI00237BBE95|nr:YxcD family protein [Paenibacillus humicola]